MRLHLDGFGMLIPEASSPGAAGLSVGEPVADGDKPFWPRLSTSVGVKVEATELRFSDTTMIAGARLNGMWGGAGRREG